MLRRKYSQVGGLFPALPLDELVKIANRRALLDGITISGKCVRLDVNDATIELTEESARIFLRAVIHSNDRAPETSKQ